MPQTFGAKKRTVGSIAFVPHACCSMSSPIDDDILKDRPMPIYEVQLTRRRTVFDESTVRVRAYSRRAAEKVDIDALEAEGKITWNCEHHDETDGVYIEEVEEVGDDDDAIEVDVNFGEEKPFKTYRIDMKVLLAEVSEIESKVVDDPETTLAHWVNRLQDHWDDQISYSIEQTGDRAFEFSLWLAAWDSLGDAEDQVVTWLADLHTWWQGITVTIEHKEEDNG